VIAPPPGGAAPSPEPSVRDAVLGRSTEGRAVRITRVGDRRAPVKVLVVGAIHGNETAGRAVVRLLRTRPAGTPGVELWLIHDLNPDGSAAGTRQNGRGVDLNRNFPAAWSLVGAPWSTYYSGPRPLSEPESRLAARLIRRLRPAVTIWYHQALTLVDLGTAGDPTLVRRYARIAGLPARRLGFLPGVATRWQNRRDRGTTAFVVELPGGALSATAAARNARAVRAVAAYAATRSR
jgi:protein MpaA